ncbi:Major facilitator superfamily domain general substrate transporter [Penicillium fimorum]|uniref:Major facilitator superfamily domain general substrate transporter n=1 Tax=Penicillium fimorum TaxID=1882269 RepID=A0A9W9Y9C7_9EURO|nr:Major facilitator superfamily domain general substrate transporter [Penicillium fimorum]
MGVPGPDLVQEQCDETDDDSTDDDYTPQDPGDQSLEDYEENESYEYDSDYETDDMCLGGEDMPDKADSEDSNFDANDDPEDRMYYNWVLQTFNPWSSAMKESMMPVGYFDNPMAGYSADAISPEEARGCRTAQFLMHKPAQRELCKADELHEPWETTGDWSLAGICDGTPSRDVTNPKVWSIRNDAQIIEADNVKFPVSPCLERFTGLAWKHNPKLTPCQHQDDVGADDIAMPFHPWCFDIFCRQSKVQFERVNVAGLMIWRNAEFDWDAFNSFPRTEDVKNSRRQWWTHEPGSEYTVANPLYVPRLPEILLAAVKNKGSPSSSDSCDEIKSAQPVTNRPSASHHSPADFLSSLPSEIQLMIIDYLDSKDVVSLSLTSKGFTQIPNSVWYRLVRKEMPWLWEAWDESECIHNPSPWTILTTADIKCVVTARSDYARALVDDSYTQLAAEKAAEHRYVLRTIPDQVKLPRVNTDWRRVFMQIQLNWYELKGLRNRQRIWVDVEEIVRRIRKFDP